MKLTYDPDGSLDEVLADNASVHIERLSKFRYSLIITEGERQLILDVSRPTVWEDAKDA